MNCFIFVTCAILLHVGYAVAYPPGQVYEYQYDTDVVFNEPHAHGTSRPHKDVGIKLSTSLQFTPVWHSQSSMLVELKINKPRLISVSRPDLTRDLKQLSRLPVYFEWEKGSVGRIFTSADDTTLAINIKKGIISMVQVTDKSVERTEIDASGECLASYTAEGEVFTKRKTKCKNLEIAGQFFNVNPILSLETNPSSVTIYELSNDIIKTMTTIEQFSPTLTIENSLAGTVKARQSLELIRSNAGGNTVKAGSLEEAVNKLNKNNNLNLFGQLLASSYEKFQQTCKNCPTPSNILEKYRVDLESSKMATESAVEAFLTLVHIFRKANKQDVLKTLQDPNNENIVPQLIDVFVAAQTEPCQEALMEYLNFDDEYEYTLPERYLLASAFSTHPTEKLLQDLLGLFKRNVPNEYLRESIAEALGAVVYSYCQVNQKEKIVMDIQDILVSKLSECEDTACKEMYLRALTNAALPGTLGIIMDHAENSKDVTVSEAAIKALRRFDRNLISPQMREVLLNIYHQRKRGYDSAIRTQVLKVLLSTGLSGEEVQGILDSTAEPTQSEFASYVLARLFNHMETDDDLRVKVQKVLVNVNISNYDVLAPNGKSLAFKEHLAHTDSMSATYDMFVENSKAHIMKRSGMDVDVQNNKQTLQLYSFGIFAAGLEGLLGEEVEAGQEDVVATAGLQLNLIDISLRPVTFFEGQSGLMSAVWNAPSELVSALQANLLLQDHTERLHLQNGLVILLSVQGAVSMDLSGLISISLWNKNCQSLIKNSGAILIQGKMSLDTSAFRTGMEFYGQAASVIDFQTDVDFYDKIKMCLQMGRPAFTYKHGVTKFEKSLGFKKSYVARVRRVSPVNAASYPLPPPNAKQCRALIKDES